MLDFELAMINAVKNVWPEAQPVSCAFHLLQSVRRHLIGNFIWKTQNLLWMRYHTLIILLTCLYGGSLFYSNEIVVHHFAFFCQRHVLHTKYCRSILFAEQTNSGNRRSQSRTLRKLSTSSELCTMLTTEHTSSNSGMTRAKFFPTPVQVRDYNLCELLYGWHQNRVHSVFRIDLYWR